MQTNRQFYVAAHLAVLICVALTATAPLSAAGNFLYVDTTATLSTNNFPGIPVPGLQLNLPAASTAYNTAVVTLNMPNLYLSQPTTKSTPMGAILQIVAPFAPGGLVVATGEIGCDTVGIGTSAKKPLTIVVKVPLGSVTQLVEAEWSSNQVSTVNTSTFASLSAILVRE